MKCFYHSADLDGHCAGAIVKYRYPDCEMIGIDYGQEFPWEKITDNKEEIFMVDFCLQPFTEMERLASVALRLKWIDHHKSAIQEYNQSSVFKRRWIAGIRKIGQGACEITWKYLFEKQPPCLQEGGNENIPLAVKLLGLYDVWNLEENKNVMPFQYGMKTKDTNPENQAFWSRFFENNNYAYSLIDQIINEGKIILEYIKIDNKRKAGSLSFETELDGLKCIAMNSLTNSQGFESNWDPEKYDAMLSFVWKGKSWTVTLFTDKPGIDVSKICKNRGGGGHKKAAGFQCAELPFRLDKEKEGDKNVHP